MLVLLQVLLLIIVLVLLFVAEIGIGAGAGARAGAVAGAGVGVGAGACAGMLVLSVACLLMSRVACSWIQTSFSIGAFTSLSIVVLLVSSTYIA